MDPNSQILVKQFHIWDIDSSARSELEIRFEDSFVEIGLHPIDYLEILVTDNNYVTYHLMNNTEFNFVLTSYEIGVGFSGYFNGVVRSGTTEYQIAGSFNQTF